MRVLLTSIILLCFSCAHQASAKYNRKEWGYPSDLDHDCQNTRAEILISRSKAPVTFTNAKKCTVKIGQWEDFYYPTQSIQASELQIDHVVPLYEANKSGGERWNANEKSRFANDEENLVITTSKTNRQKGRTLITQWLPINKAYSCAYLKKWIYIKTKYSLSISLEEKEAVTKQACH